MSNSSSVPPTDEEEQASPDITVEITNGKTVKINFDKGEWFIISCLILALSYLVGEFGWV
jgi:hypothetical protein